MGVVTWDIFARALLQLTWFRLRPYEILHSALSDNAGLVRSCKLVLFVFSVSRTAGGFREVETRFGADGRTLAETVDAERSVPARKRKGENISRIRRVDSVERGIGHIASCKD